MDVFQGYLEKSVPSMKLEEEAAIVK